MGRSEESSSLAGKRQESDALRKEGTPRMSSEEATFAISVTNAATHETSTFQKVRKETNGRETTTEDKSFSSCCSANKKTRAELGQK